MSNYYFEILFFILGAIWGSFANVMIYRIPKNLSVVTPRSHCYQCGKTIAWYDNIPILAWFILRGKCRYCKAPFSIRYPMVELIMGLLFAGLYMKLGFSWFLLEMIVFTVAAVSAAFIDLDHFILPDVFTLGGLGLGLLGALINPEREFWDALGGAVAGGGFLWGVAYLYWIWRKEEGMGGGDIKLLAWLGSLLGFLSVPFIILTSSVLGAVIGLILMRRGNKGLQTAIPFGPYLIVAAYIYLFAGEPIARWYMTLFLPEFM